MSKNKQLQQQPEQQQQKRQQDKNELIHGGNAYGNYGTMMRGPFPFLTSGSSSIRASDGQNGQGDADGNAAAEIALKRKQARLEDLIGNIDKPGMRFVTIFCDDQKVPLPPKVVDILSKQGEKIVPGSVSRCYEVAKTLNK